MAQIKFKRALSHNGDLDSAITNIKTLGLAPGEPILCSYVEDDVDKYLFAIGVKDGNIKIIPAFTDEDDLIAYIQSHVDVFNIDNIAEESDVKVIKKDSKMILTIEDKWKNIWIDLNHE